MDNNTTKKTTEDSAKKKVTPRAELVRQRKMAVLNYFPVPATKGLYLHDGEKVYRKNGSPLEPNEDGTYTINTRRGEERTFAISEIFPYVKIDEHCETISVSEGSAALDAHLISIDTAIELVAPHSKKALEALEAFKEEFKFSEEDPSENETNEESDSPNDDSEADEQKEELGGEDPEAEE